MYKIFYALLLAGYCNLAYAADQIITPSPANQTATPSSAVDIALGYNTAPAPVNSTGLGLRVHFDSSQLAPPTNTIGPDGAGFLLSTQVLADAGNEDGDANTDKILLFAWADFTAPADFPGTVPGVLATLHFTTTAGFSGSTTVNFTASSTAAGFGFIATPAVISEASAPLPTVSISATIPNASEAGPSAGEFTISRTGSTVAPLSVTFSTTGTAGAGDYVALTGSATIPAGATTVAIPVTPIDDTVVESAETVIVSLTTSANYDIGTGSASVTIADNDNPPVVPNIDGMTEAAAIAALEAAGYTVTITYQNSTTVNPGLVISNSQSPALRTVNIVVSGAAIVPTSVPSLSFYGLLLLSSLLGFAAKMIRR